MTTLASDICPELTNERLAAIVRIYAESRLGAAERQDTDFGDDAQVWGMRAYKNACMNLEALAGSEGWEWLKTFERQRKFTLIIGDVPIRVWRSDDPDAEPEDRRLDVAHAASPQLSLLHIDGEYLDRWAIVYQTGFDGFLDAASLIGYHSFTKQIIRSFSIPLDGIIPIGLAAVDDLPEAVKLDKPKAKLKLVEVIRNRSEDEITD